MSSKQLSEYSFPFRDPCEKDMHCPTTSPRTRKRAASLLSISSTYSSKTYLDLPKTTPTLVLAVCPGKHNAFGAFTPTISASASLRSLVNSSPPRAPFTHNLGHPRHAKRPMTVWTTSYHEPAESSSTSNSPISLPDSPTSSIPFIGHTSSQAAFSSTLLDNPSLREGRKGKIELNPILATLEKKSKLCTRRVSCATCKKSGTDYPRCGKCGEMWCSRDCRLRGGNRHLCSRSSRKF